MDEALFAYLEDKRRRGHSRVDVEGARCLLTRLFHHLRGLGMNHLGDVTPRALYAFFAGRKLAPITLYGYRGMVRLFFRFLIREGYLLADPFPQALCGRPPPYPLRQVPTRRDVRGLLSRVAARQRTPVRDRAIVEIVYGSGLRRGEVMRLDLGDFRGEEVRVLGKGGKERIVPVGRVAQKWLWNYIASEREEVAKRYHPLEAALFLGQTGKRLCGSGLGRILEKEKGIGLHRLRHACATHMLKEGASIVHIQKLLGHSLLVTTALYTSLETEDMKKLLQRFHPRS